jgi:hypothetical protein
VPSVTFCSDKAILRTSSNVTAILVVSFSPTAAPAPASYYHRLIIEIMDRQAAGLIVYNDREPRANDQELCSGAGVRRHRTVSRGR